MRARLLFATFLHVARALWKNNAVAFLMSTALSVRAKFIVKSRAFVLHFSRAPSQLRLSIQSIKTRIDMLLRGKTSPAGCWFALSAVELRNGYYSFTWQHSLLLQPFFCVVMYVDLKNGKRREKLKPLFPPPAARFCFPKCAPECGSSITKTEHRATRTESRCLNLTID